MPKVIIGIDPGASGAIAVINDGRFDEVRDMPTIEVKRGPRTINEVSPSGLASLIPMNASHAFVEKVGAMPGQGVSSMFAFGNYYGMIQGILAAKGIPYTLVTPQKWQKDMSVREGKDGARERARQLLPDSAEYLTRVKDHGRADAILIALWGSRQTA